MCQYITCIVRLFQYPLIRLFVGSAEILDSVIYCLNICVSLIFDRHYGSTVVEAIITFLNKSEQVPWFEDLTGSYRQDLSDTETNCWMIWSSTLNQLLFALQKTTSPSLVRHMLHAKHGDVVGQILFADLDPHLIQKMVGGYFASFKSELRSSYWNDKALNQLPIEQ